MEKKEYTGTRSRSSGGFIWEMMEGSWKYFWGCVAAMTEIGRASCRERV